jgi:hypothetical protein
MFDKSRKLLQAIAVRWRRNSARGAAMLKEDFDGPVELVPTEKRPPIPPTILPNGAVIWPNRALLFPTGYAARTAIPRKQKK